MQPLSINLPPAVENNLFRIAVEAMTNAVRHAKPGSMELELVNSDTTLMLRITDDGTGFDPTDDPAKPGHFGVLGMRERARQLNASLEILSQAGAGTDVRLILLLTSTNPKKESEL